MAHPAVEADKMLDVYIHDYLTKKKYNNSAKTFQEEAQLPTKSTAIDTPGSFLFEWWSVFWDVFISRYKRPGTNNEPLTAKAKEHPRQPQQQRQPNSEQQWLQQMQLQLFLQHQEQTLQRRCHSDEIRLQHSTTRNNLAKQSALAQKMKENLNLQCQKDFLSEAEIEKFMKHKFSANAGQLSDATTHASMLRSAVGGDQPPERLLHNPPAGNMKSFLEVKNRMQQPVASENLKNLMTPPIITGPAVSVSNLAVNTSPLRGWPLMGLDRLQPKLVHQKKSFPHPDDPSQLQLHQQIRKILTGQNIEMENIGIDSQWNLVGNDISDILPIQVGHPILSYGDAWMQLQKSNHDQQQTIQSILGPQSENLDYQFQLPDRAGAAGSSTEDVPMSDISKDCNQERTFKKRKQPIPSGGPNALTQCSAPSAPSAPTTGDIISLPTLPPGDNSSEAELDKVVDRGSLEDDVDSFLSHDKPKTGIAAAELLDTNRDITFSEIATIYANGVNCCDLSFDGNIVATGGDDKKAVLWCTESRKQKYVIEHSGPITDTRFGPRLPRLATSSFDKTVKIWNVDNPGCPLRTFVGHTASVMSVDFHPKKEDLVCSCDDASSIRYWSVKNGGCTGMATVCATQVRFEPTRGRYLAAAVGNGVSIIDVETMQTYRYPLKGHAMDVLSVCWNPTGEYLASMSEDSIRVWKIGSWGVEDCMHELSIPSKKFCCCAFHPGHSSLLVIGFTESLELWDMAENKMLRALEQPTNTLAVSNPAGLVASVSGDNLIKLWK